MTLATERSAPPTRRWVIVLRIVLVFVILYLFLAGMSMMGDGLKELGRNPTFDKTQPQVEGNRPYREAVYRVFSHAGNPMIGLFLGLLATSIFQSSSFTASFVVSLVVTTPLTLHQAIFIIMGVNIGTCVTNTGVSFTHVRRADEFKRAYGAAITHEIFNTLTVLILFPVEWIVWRLTGKGLLERVALSLASHFYVGVPAGRQPTNFVKDSVKPVVEATEWLIRDVAGLGHVTTSLVLAVVGVAILFAALLGLTKVLRSLVMKRVEGLFDRVLFRNSLIALLVGLALTMTVQCSSVTTSLLVPLVAAGLLQIGQAYHYTLGANIGTTVTALIASFAASADTPQQAQVGVALAFSHTLFNVIGVAIWYPLRRVPIAIARWHAGHAAKWKRYAVLHVTGFFFALPLLVILLHWIFA